MVKRFDDGGQVPGYSDDENPFGAGDDEVVVIPPYEPPSNESDWDWDNGANIGVREAVGGEMQEWLGSIKGVDWTSSPTNKEIEAAILQEPSIGQKIINGLTAAGKALVTKKDGSVDWTKVAAMAGAAYAYNRNQQSAVDLSGVGTKAGIASLTAAREQVPYQSDANRTPGSGGRRYFTDVKYADKTKADEVAAAQQAAETQARGLAALQSKSGGVYGTLVNPLPGSGGTAGSGNNMGPGFVAPTTSNGSITSGSGYGPGGAPETAPKPQGATVPATGPFAFGGGASFTPEQSQAAIAANTAQIKQDLAGLNTDAALNAYLAKTTYTPEQLAIATGYSAADIAAKMHDAWRGQSSQNTQQWLDSAYAPTSTQAPVPGTVIGGTQAAAAALAPIPAPAPVAYAPQPDYYAPIQADIANLSSLGSQDALNSYLANTNYSADQLAAASGYNVADVQAAMNAAQNSNWYSAGGQVRGYADGGYLDGATNGQSDEIPATIEGEEQARLSHGEFILPADAVAALGGGNSNAGAEVLYDMLDRIREQAYGHKQQMRPVDQNTLPA